MIDFTKGSINFGQHTITTTSDYRYLKSLATEGLIAKRNVHKAKPDYYFEVIQDDMRLGVFVRIRGEKIEWILLRWLDRPMKGWEDVSERAMANEYHLISNYIKTHVGGPPDSKKMGSRSWRLGWGELSVSCEVRSFDVAIFMKPQSNIPEHIYEQ